jgi:hypothetical protein
VTFILPSGYAALDRVYADRSQFETANDLETVGNYAGINGVLTPADYAYTTGVNIRAAFLDWERSPRSSSGQRDDDLHVQAVDGNGVPCAITITNILR